MLVQNHLLLSGVTWDPGLESDMLTYGVTCSVTFSSVPLAAIDVISTLFHKPFSPVPIDPSSGAETATCKAKFHSAYFSPNAVSSPVILISAIVKKYHLLLRKSGVVHDQLCQCCLSFPPCPPCPTLSFPCQ